MKRNKLTKSFAVLMLLMACLLLPYGTAAAASKTFTPIGQYYGAKVKLGKYYVYRGGPDGRWFGFSKKKNPTEEQESVIAAREDAVSNGTVVYCYHDDWDPGNSIRSHTIWKVTMKNNSRKKLKVVKDKQDPTESSWDGFRFGTAYNNKLYYNATAKLTKKDSSYVRTFKLVRLDTKTKKTKTVRKDFEILGCTKEYIFGRTVKNKYYVFKLKNGRFYKVSGISKDGVVITHAYKNTVYGAQFTKKRNEGYGKIVLFSFNGAKKKIKKLKTWTISTDRFLDGCFEVNGFKYTKSLVEFYKYNLSTKKISTISDRDYDYDLAPDYGDGEE